MSNEKMREAFEAWARRNLTEVTDQSFKRMPVLEHLYENGHMEALWQCCQAFTAATQRDVMAVAARIEELERELAEARNANTHAGLRALYQRAMSECDDALRLVAEVRHACGDDGKRMLTELVQYVGELAKDAARYRWLQQEATRDYVQFNERVYELADDLDEAIDAAMEQTKNREGA